MAIHQQFKVGLDTAEYKDEAKKLAAFTTDNSRKIAADWSKSVKPVGREISETRREVGNFLKQLGKANSPAEAFAEAIDKLGDSLKIGIIAGFAGNAIKSIFNNADEYEKKINKLSDSFEEFRRTSSKSDTAKDIGELISEATEARKKVKELGTAIDEVNGLDPNGDSPIFTMRNFQRVGGALLAGGFGDPTSENSIQGRQEQLAAAMEKDKAATQKIEEDRMAEVSFRRKQQEKQLESSIRAASGNTGSFKAAALASEMERIARQDLAHAKAADNRETNEIKKRELALNLAERAAREADAESKLQEHSLKIEDRMADARMSASSAVEKNYRLASLTAELADAQLEAAKSLNVEQEKSATIKAREARFATQKLDEQLNVGKSAKATRSRIQAQEKEERNLEKFRKRREKDRGVIVTRRGTLGRVEEGINPVTGDKVKFNYDIFGKATGQAQKNALAALAKTVGPGTRKEREARANAIIRKAEEDKKKVEFAPGQIQLLAAAVKELITL